jgi:hypothetical protein
MAFNETTTRKDFFMKASIIRLNPQTKKLLKTMSFPEIPEEANFIAFTEDGDAQFLEDVTGLGMSMPTMIIVAVYEEIEIAVE